MARGTLRPIRVEGNIAYVRLTRGVEAIIDAEDVHLVAGRNWHNQGRYAASWAECGTVLMHRVILSAPDGSYVDHVSGDGFDNRKANLRVATLSQNQHNARVRNDSRSGVKGVAWHKGRQMWHAQIRLNGKRKHLGYFALLDDAAEAYRLASKDLHGSFSRTA